jgi:hypothetical protein
MADRAVARSDTPFWMRHTFGEVPAEYRLPLGLFAIILIVSAMLSILNVGNSVIAQLMDLLKAVLGGLIGGAMVKRSINGPDKS